MGDTKDHELTKQDALTAQLRRDFEAEGSALEGIRQGLEDLAAGRTRPAREIFDKLRSNVLPVEGHIETLVAEFDRNNAHLVAGTESMLSGFIADRPAHARFMNTLSMLEHMGSHKIMATQHGLGIDQPTLKHLAEETRHAFFFKRHANREAGRTLEYTAADMIAPLAARRYFQRLEAEMVRAFPADIHPRATYLTMSMVVEFRAVWGYRLYQTALVKARSMVSLKSLLAEEAGHLIDMAERLQGLGELNINRTSRFCAIETKLYARLVSSFAECSAYSEAA